MKKAHNIHKALFAVVLSVLLVLSIFVKVTNEKIIVRQDVNYDYPSLAEDPDGVITNNFVADSRRIPPTNPDFEPVLPQEPITISSVVKESLVENKIVDSAGKIYELHKYETTALPNDPQANQWWVSAIGMEAFWTAGRGPNPTTIAIIDTGFDMDHQELTGRWYENDGEQGVTAVENPSDLNCTDQGLPLDASCNNIDDNYDGIVDNETGAVSVENPSRLNCTDQGLPLDKSCNLIDDDGNGLVDDWRGWDFANFDGFVEAGETNPSGDETDHGTMVAGVAAGTGNNGVGMAGVDWGSEVLPIQVFDDDGYADTLIVSRAIRYAADMGADVINLSLGTSFYDAYLRQAVSYAIEAGSLVVASAGNSPCNCMVYPANFAEVIAVGASNSSGERASFSSYGANLDLMAPGTNIVTSTWSNSSNSQYTTVAGTSFSSPLVAGLLAVARSYYLEATWAELVAALTETTDRSLLSVNQAHSSNYGFGISSADDFISRINTPKNIQQIIKFLPLRTGNQLSSTQAYQCDSGQYGSTALYEMNNNGLYRYTLNKHEHNALLTGGWNSRLLGYVCLSLPDDTAQETRFINMALEFSNVSPKNID